jgi:hypothetical protein
MDNFCRGGTYVSPLRGHTQVRSYVSSVYFRPQLGMNFGGKAWGCP